MKLALNVALVVLAVVPLGLGAIAVAVLLPETIPMRIGFDGVVNGWGRKSDDMLLAALLTFANVIVAVCGIFAEKLWSLGMVSGVGSPHSARVVCLITVAIVDAVFVGIILWQMSYA